MSSTTGTGPEAQPIISPELVRLDVSLGDDKTTVIRGLADIVATAGRTADASGLADDALAREATSPTGLPGGIAIPHCRTEARRRPDARLRAPGARHRLRRQGRPGRHRLPDRRPGRR